MNTEYAKSLAAANAASAKFAVAQNAYRARTIGDAEFLAAKAEHDKASAEFDAAFAKESAND